MKANIFFGRQWDRIPEEIPVIEIPRVKNKPYGYVWFSGDWHIGHNSFADHPFEVALAMLEKHPEFNKACIALMGDLIELEELTSFVKEADKEGGWQLTEVAGYLEPFRNRVVSYLYGNHERRLLKAGGGKATTKLVTSFVKNEFGTEKTLIPSHPLRGLLVIFKITYRDLVEYYPTYMAHGYTAARVTPEIQFRRIAPNFNVQLVALGHTHLSLWKDFTFYAPVVLEPGKFGKGVFRQFWLSTGAYLKFPGYAERSGYRLTKVGCPIVRFYASENKMEPVDTSYWMKDPIAGTASPRKHYHPPISLWKASEFTSLRKSINKKIEITTKKNG